MIMNNSMTVYSLQVNDSATHMHTFYFSVFFSGKPSLLELFQLKIPQQVGPHYKIFGTFLLNDKTGSQVDNIRRACLGDPKDIVVSILEEWIAGRGRLVTWETLIKTLRDCDLNPLALEVENFVVTL